MNNAEDARLAELTFPGSPALAGRIMPELAPPGGFENHVALVLYRHPAADAAVPPRP